MPGCVRSAKTADPAGFRRGKEEATRRKILPLGVPQFDEVLQGGLPLEGMMEIRNAETRDAGAAAGFVAALAVLYQRQKKENGRLAPVAGSARRLLPVRRVSLMRRASRPMDSMPSASSSFRRAR